MQFEVTEQACRSVSGWIVAKQLAGDDWLFPSRQKTGAHLTTRQYGRLIAIGWCWWGSTRHHAAPTACGGRKWPCFTRRSAT